MPMSKKTGVPPCPYKVVVELNCPVPGCLWHERVEKNGDIPPFRKEFAIHWNTEHFGQWELLKDVDLSDRSLETARMLKELDRILPEDME